MINSDVIELLEMGFQKFDITKNISLEYENKVPAEMQFIMNKITVIFHQYWKDNLKELGIKDTMKNYSKVYPINLLEKSDLSLFEDFLNLVSEDDKKNCNDANYEINEFDLDQFNDLCKDFNLIKLYDYMFSEYNNETFATMLKPLFEYFQKCVDKEFKKSAEMLGRSKEDMTEEEKLNIWQTVFDSLARTGTLDLMLGQKVPEIFNLAKARGTIEDFSDKKENHPKIDFLRKQYGLRRKFDSVLSFDELAEEDLVDLNCESDFEQISDEEIDKAVAAFVDTLADVERTIYFMKQDGCTQEEIAKALGYKTHSAVTKRLAKMKEKAIRYCESIDF